MLLQQQGYIINHKTVLKIMRELCLFGKQSKKAKKYNSYQGEVGIIAPNLLKRNFEAEKTFEKLATDVSEFKVGDEKAYLSPVLDMCNGEIVAYSISRSPNFEQIRQMLKQLFEKMPKGKKPLLHSDQGWQYQMKQYQELLVKHNIVQSMSRKGNCMDNGRMENFFGRMKVEMYYGEKFKDIDELIDKMEEYIYYYNNTRIINKLKMSPIQYRTMLENDY